MLASPKIGVINLVLQTLFDTDAVIVNIYTHGGNDLGRRAALFAGMAVPADDGGVSIHGSFARGAGGDERKPRCRRSHGGSRCGWPGRRRSGSLLILFVRSIESFEVPALLRAPGR